MSSFNPVAWQSAAADLDDTQPPEPGLYEVTVQDAGAFTSKAGNDIVKVEYRITNGTHQGHTWTVISGFKSEGAIGVTKSMCSRLGAPVDSVNSLEELDQALQTAIGQYFLVEVKQNGQYRNTYVDRRLTEGTPASDIPEPKQEEFVHTPAADDDEPVPF